MPLIVILKILKNRVCGKLQNPRWRPRWRLADTSFKIQDTSFKYDFLTNKGRNKCNTSIAILTKLYFCINHVNVDVSWKNQAWTLNINLLIGCLSVYGRPEYDE